MAPTPQEVHSATRHETVNSELDGDAVVISGMAGLFPESSNVSEFSNILYNKINPVIVGKPHWSDMIHPEVPQYSGNIPYPDTFDAQFFKVHYQLSSYMDVMARKVLEMAYEAIYDSGLTVEHVSGKNIGVYVGSFISETERASIFDISSRTPFSLTGCSKTMFANRISYWLNARGPSLSVEGDGTCSHTALELGYLAIKRGECDAAIVAGCSVCWHPNGSVYYGRVMPISYDGTTKCFDQDAHGFSKSEAISVIFLQRAKDALRIYAEVVHVKTIHIPEMTRKSFAPRGFVREPEDLANFLKTFYEEAKVPAHCVDYIEAFGSAIPEADKAELEAFSEVFCKNRTTPLLVGSVTSNVGYTEAASGLTAITKVLLGYHTGELAGNLHCENPRQDVAALTDGRMRILTDHQRIEPTTVYAAVNSLSLCGLNAHVLLRRFYKQKDPSGYKTSIPRLVAVSGRQESCVQKIIDDLKSRPVDPEEIALINHIHEAKINGHLARGFVLLDTKDGKTESVAERADYYGDDKPPLWFVYSGMGSQWASMGAQLMRFPTFAAAIERCRRVLEPKGVDLVHILTSPDKTMYDNILHSFVGIAAVQVGITDILNELGLVPDKIIGHSVGEMGCAYADGCFTAEEMMLAAYSRGLISIQTPFIRGSMAAVGIGYQKMSKLCPPEIEVACHNGPESCTISGPAEPMKEYVTKLVDQGIFAKEVPCSNIAYHSRYIAEAGPKFLELLSEVIKDPKPRSERWLSTSVPMDQWNEDKAKYSSAWYHTNNLLSPVLFEETSRLVPPNAVVVEVAPHGLLQAILKRSLPISCVHIPLTLRAHPDNVIFFLDAIGKLFMQGYNMKIKNLYPQVQFPVSTGTPFLSPLVDWVHDTKWMMPYYYSADRRTSSSYKFVVSLYDDNQSYLKGHVIEGNTTYPFAAALVAVWDTLAMTLGVPRQQVSVQYRDVHLFVQPILSWQRQKHITVSLHRGTGLFEVMDEFAKIATGYIKSVKNIDTSRAANAAGEQCGKLNLESHDVYKLLEERDYAYSGDFRSIHKTNTSFTEAQLVWNDNWVTLIDGMLQLNVLGHDHETVSQPSHIGKISIDVQAHQDNKTILLSDKTVIPVNISNIHSYTRCGGILFETVQFYDSSPLNQDTLALKSLTFVPRFKSNSIDLVTTFKVYMQIIAENVNADVIQVVGLLSNSEYIFNGMKNLLDDVPGVNFRYTEIDMENILKGQDGFSKVDMVILKNLSKNEMLCQDLHRVLRPGTFIINAEEYEGGRVLPSTIFRVLSVDSAGRTRLELGRWRPAQAQTPASVISVRKHADIATLTTTRARLVLQQKLTVITTYPPVPGLKDLIKQWRRELERNQVYLVMIAGNENIEKLPELDLAFNVLVNDVWGGEYYMSCKERVSVEREVTLKMTRAGDLDSLQWVEMSEPSETGLKVTVRYAGINNFDVKRATEVIPFKQDNNEGFGMDYSGTTDNGERVMGIVRGGAASGCVRALPQLVWPVPTHWTLEDAATVPSAYAQAFYLLGIRSQLEPGMSVLVHGGAGALGQAAISVALANGCKVFTTVGDVRKKVFLQRLFPDLKGEYIGNSRDHTFLDMVLQATNGIGCDVIISSAKGELKNATLHCAAFGGITYDTAQVHTEDTYAYGMYFLTKQRSYALVDFVTIFDYEEDMKVLHAMMSDGIARGFVRPLSRVTYAPNDASRAFRLLAASRHRGRVLLRLRDSVVAAQPRITCSPDHCHLLICDKEGFGLQWANRLVSRGARKLMLHCSKITPHIELKAQFWQKLGVRVKVSSEDLSSKSGVVSLLMDSVRMGPVEGVHVIISNNEKEKNVDEISSLVSNIDLVSRESCPSIRYFAVVSTIDSIGQQTCLSRAKNKLPSTLLHMPALHNEVPVSWRSALDATESALRSKQPLLFAQPLKKAQLPLLNRIAAIADIKIPVYVKKSDTLINLGLDQSKSLAISAFLQHSHHVAFTEESVSQLTVEQIEKIEGLVNKSELKKAQGLGKFISHVGSDEVYYSTEMVIMPTLHRELWRNDELDMNHSYMCIVSGLEANHDRFRSLCLGLKMSSVVLQPGLENLDETPRETAARYAKILHKKLGIKNNFFLLGYESGVITALELASILEEEGLTGTVFCVGGSPKEIQATINEELCGLGTEQALQGAVARHMCAVMAADSLPELEHKLRDAATWHETLDACVVALRARVRYTMQFSRLVVEAAYARIKQTLNYEPQPIPLRSRIVALNITSVFRDTSPAHSLQRYSLHPVVYYDLDAPLEHAVDDLRCANFINRHLGAEILEVFEKKNMCQTYIQNNEIYTIRKVMPDTEKDQV